MPQSASYMRSLRRKYGLGEFSKSKSRSRKRGKASRARKASVCTPRPRRRRKGATRSKSGAPQFGFLPNHESSGVNANPMTDRDAYMRALRARNPSDDL